MGLHNVAVENGEANGTDYLWHDLILKDKAKVTWMSTIAHGYPGVGVHCVEASDVEGIVVKHTNSPFSERVLCEITRTKKPPRGKQKSKKKKKNQKNLRTQLGEPN